MSSEIKSDAPSRVTADGLADEQTLAPRRKRSAKPRRETLVMKGYGLTLEKGGHVKLWKHPTQDAFRIELSNGFATTTLYVSAEALAALERLHAKHQNLPDALKTFAYRIVVDGLNKLQAGATAKWEPVVEAAVAGASAEPSDSTRDGATQQTSQDQQVSS